MWAYLGECFKSEGARVLMWSREVSSFRALGWRIASTRVMCNERRIGRHFALYEEEVPFRVNDPRERDDAGDGSDSEPSVDAGTVCVGPVSSAVETPVM